MKKIEILAPAGSLESIKPAVRCGANAVYLGGENFSARAGAKNFSRDDLIKTIEYCHARRVKVYIALNTLVFDYEIEKVVDYVKFVCNLGVDALIIQDVGLAKIIKNIAPKMPLHASTQMSVHTLSGVKALHDAGFNRVVLARELSLEEIKEISKDSPIELEVFVHGALCMSVSGQCYFSAMLGGRSGNRGRCAQPCRLPFFADGGNGHDLSLKDMSIIKYIKQLQDIGIKSAKIEGRMKRPEYVATAVRACRAAVDGEDLEEVMKELRSIFSRSGFTDGYYQGNRGKHMFGIREKENVIEANRDIFAKAHQLYKHERQVIPIDMNFIARKGSPIELEVSDGNGHELDVLGNVPQEAVSKSISKERCEEQLSKTGGTQFFCSSLNCDLDKGLAISSSDLNSLRRKALSLIEKEIIKDRAKIDVYDLDLKRPKPYTSEKMSIRARFVTSNVPKEFSSCEFVYVPLDTQLNELKRLKDMGLNIAVEIPRGIFGREAWCYKKLEEIKSIGMYDVLASNIGAIKIAKDLNMNIHGGFALNIANTYSLQYMKDIGLKDAELSFEMTLGDIRNLGGDIKRGIIGYGRLPLMLTRNCPAKNIKTGCKGCKKSSVIRDRKQKEFPLMCQSGCTEILNSVPLYLADKQSEINGIDFMVLRFTVENSVESVEILNHFNNHVKKANGITRGLYYRGVN